MAYDPAGEQGAVKRPTRATPRPWGLCPQTPGVFRFGPMGHRRAGLVSWRAITRTTTRGIGPFAEARRSGCPPAEPYPAGDEPCSTTTHPMPEISAALLGPAGKKLTRNALAPCQPPPQSIRKRPSEVVHFEVITGGAF